MRGALSDQAQDGLFPNDLRRPVSVLASFAAPPAEVMGWHDIVREALKENGVRLVTYVPDNVLNPLIGGLHADPEEAEAADEQHLALEHGHQGLTGGPCGRPRTTRTGRTVRSLWVVLAGGAF